MRQKLAIQHPVAVTNIGVVHTRTLNASGQNADKVPSTVKTTQNQRAAFQHGIVTPHTVMVTVSPRSVTVLNNMILRSVALGNAAKQLAKHKQVYKWAAERVLNRTDIQWSRSRMPTLASLEDVQHLFSPDVREAVLTKFTAGTVLESAKGGPLILGYDCDDMPTLATLTDFFATQGLPAALTETTRKDYDSDWRGWVTFCVVMCKPNAVLPADKQVLMAFLSQLILCQYATGMIGKFLSCIMTKTGVPVAAIVSRDGFLVAGFEEKHKQRCEN